MKNSTYKNSVLGCRLSVSNFSIISAMGLWHTSNTISINDNCSSTAKFGICVVDLVQIDEKIEINQF